MYFRSRRKTAGDVSLSDALDVDGEGLSMIDVVASDEDLAERIGSRELCLSLKDTVKKVLTKREAQVIRLRYGIGGGRCRTQSETAGLCGISRSYVSRIEKKALAKLRETLGEDCRPSG